MSTDTGQTREPTYPTNGVSLVKCEPQYVIQINGLDNVLMVGIKYDGTIVYGENYQPDDAAKIFWNAITGNMPTLLQLEEDPANRTPWAVICKKHGKQYLTCEQYDDQMMESDLYWYCPVCGGMSEWDDNNFEAYINEDN